MKFIPDDIIHRMNLSTVDLSNNHWLSFLSSSASLEQFSSLIYSRAFSMRWISLSYSITKLIHLDTFVLSHSSSLHVSSVIYELMYLQHLNVNDHFLVEIELVQLPQSKNIWIKSKPVVIISIDHLSIGFVRNRWQSGLSRAFKWLYRWELSYNIVASIRWYQ
jgi:hypothetical protein